jgi:3',5'-cyclic AMP phosphodiesterase CpdA
MRIVALSDQHGFLPDIPPCDLLILAGDVCPDRFGPFMAVNDPHLQQAWFDRKVRPWLAGAPATHKLLTWGNHDWCGQACSFRSDSPALAQSTDLQILVDEGTTVPLSGGEGGHVSVWATPWSNRFMRWAFMKQPRDLEPVYAAIPGGTDVLVSHQPPYIAIVMCSPSETPPIFSSGAAAPLEYAANRICIRRRMSGDWML